MSLPPPPPPPPGPPPPPPKTLTFANVPSLTQVSERSGWLPSSLLTLSWKALAVGAGRDSAEDDSFDDAPAPPPPPPPSAPVFAAPIAAPSYGASDAASPVPEAGVDAGAPAAAAAPAHDGPSWTRPWTLGEMRNNSSDWTLACDSGLLNFLKEFGSKMMQRTKDLDRQVSGLVADTQRTNVLLLNTVNEFLLLSNTQFVESRVWGEDERNKAEPEKTESLPPENGTATSAAASGEEIDVRYKEAIALGVAAMSLTAFGREPKVRAAPPPTVPDDPNAPAAPVPEEKSEESESEDAHDKFNLRPLPFVIGTEEFDEDDHVGLYDPERPDEFQPEPEPQGDEDDDEEESSSEEDAPQSAQLGPDDVEHVDANAPASGGLVAVNEPGAVADPGQAAWQPPGDMSQQQGGGEVEGAPPAPVAATPADMGGVGPPRTLADELASRLGVAPKPVAAAPVQEQQPQQQEEPVANADPFSAAAPSNAWGNSLFQENTPAPVDIFATSSKGMFDTESIFSDTGAAPSIDIFSATVDDIFGAAPPKKAADASRPAPPTAAPAPAAARVQDDIFGGSIFGDAQVAAAPAAAVSSAPARKVPVAPTDLFGGDVFGEAPAAKPAAAPVDFFGSFEAAPAPTPIAAAPAASSVPPPAIAVTESPPKQAAAPPAAIGAKKPVGAVSMFGGVDLFSGASPGTPSLSRNSRSASVSNRPTTPSNVVAEDLPAPPAAVESNLFGTPPSASAVPVPAAAGARKPAGAVSLFGGVDLFGTSPSESSGMFVTKKPAPAAAAEPSSLFDGSDLFGSSPPKKHAVAAKKPAVVSGGLFGDDDFGSMFATPAKPVVEASKPAPAPVAAAPAVAEKKTETPAAEAVPPPAKKGPVGAVSMFGGVDLFGGAAPNVHAKKEAELFGDRPPPPQKGPSPANVPAEKPKPPVSNMTSLFGDDHGADSAPFAAVKPANSNASSKQPPSLFGGGGDDDLFAVKPKAVPAVKTAAPTATKAATNPLFGDASDDLFSLKPAVVAVKPAPTAAAPATVASPAKLVFSDPLSGSPSGKVGGGSKIASLGAGINFNPAMLMGGGRPTPKAAPEPEIRVSDTGTVEVANAGKRLGDEATQGAKVRCKICDSVFLFLMCLVFLQSKATLRRKGGRRAPTRKKAEDEWDEDDEEAGDDPVTPSSASTLPSVATSTPPSSSSFLSSLPPPSPSSGVDIFSASSAAVTADLPELDIFAGSAAPVDIFGAEDAPSIF